MNQLLLIVLFFTTFGQLEDRLDDIVQGAADFTIASDLLESKFNAAEAARDNCITVFEVDFECYPDIADRIQDLLGQMEGIEDQVNAAKSYDLYLADQVVFWQSTIHSTPPLNPGFYTPYYNVMGNLVSQINAKIGQVLDQVYSAQATVDAWDELLDDMNALTPCDELGGGCPE